MKVVIGNKTWRMSKEEFQGLLKVASEQVLFGIYAIEKGDYAELMNKKCKSRSELKSLKRVLKEKGFKVHVNG